MRALFSIISLNFCLASPFGPYMYQTDAYTPNVQSSASVSTFSKPINDYSYAYQTDVAELVVKSYPSVTRLNELMKGSYAWERLCTGCYYQATKEIRGALGERIVDCQDRCVKKNGCTAIAVGTGARVGYCWIQIGGNYRATEPNGDSLVMLKPYAHKSRIFTYFYQLTYDDWQSNNKSYTTAFLNGLKNSLSDSIGLYSGVVVSRSQPLMASMMFTTMVRPDIVKALVRNTSFEFPVDGIYRTVVSAPGSMPAGSPASAPAVARNNYRKAKGIGAWGGKCTCPDGQVYQVGQIKGTNCKSLACENGKSGRCQKSYSARRKGMKVTCAVQENDKDFIKEASNPFLVTKRVVVSDISTQAALEKFSHSFTEMDGTVVVQNGPVVGDTNSKTRPPTGNYYAVCPKKIGSCTITGIACKRPNGNVLLCCGTSNLSQKCVANSLAKCWYKGRTCPDRLNSIIVENGYVRGLAEVLLTPGQKFSMKSLLNELSLKFVTRVDQIQVQSSSLKRRKGNIRYQKVNYLILTSIRERDVLWGRYYREVGKTFRTPSYFSVTLEGFFIDPTATCDTWKCSRAGGLCANGNAICCSKTNKAVACSTPPCWFSGSQCPTPAPVPTPPTKAPTRRVTKSPTVKQKVKATRTGR